MSAFTITIKPNEWDSSDWEHWCSLPDYARQDEPTIRYDYEHDVEGCTIAKLSITNDERTQVIRNGTENGFDITYTDGDVKISCNY